MSDYPNDHPEAVAGLFAEAVGLHRTGDLNRAEGLYRKILGLDQEHADTLHLLGALLCQKGRLEEGVSLLRRAANLSPANLMFHYNLGCALFDMKDTEEAAVSFSTCLQLNPEYDASHFMLGLIAEKLGNPDEAVKNYEQAVRCNPGNARAFHNLGILYGASGQSTRAVSMFLKAIGIRPDYADAYVSLAGICKDQGRIEEAVTQLKKALEVQPDHHLAHSNLVFTLHSLPHITPEELYDEHRKWDRTQGSRFLGGIMAHGNDSDPVRRLRIGYVSPDFRTHPVAYFIDAIFRNHDHNGFEIYCYSLVDHPDAVTEHLRKYADHWREIRAFTATGAAECIRADRIDILVDLAGHTGVNQMPIFACKPAPVQVAHIGYPNTTGLSAMDYRITDAFADPPGMTERLHTEKLVRPGRCFLCYTPPENTPDVGRLPVTDTGRITFGCFNNRSKINGRVIAAWSRILNVIPDADLILKTGSFHDPDTREELYRQFGRHGIGRDRVILKSFLPSKPEHLSLYNHIDIALDTFPYNGTTTTCEASFMGVPTIVLEGTSHYSRVGVSILSCLGLEDLIAETEEDYASKAVALAADIPRLLALRCSLREMMQRSCLMDGKGFTSGLEREYRNLWRIWCHKAS